MRNTITRLGFAAALLASASGRALAQAAPQAASQVPTSGPRPEGSPDSIALPWGTFKLADRVAEKICRHEPLNVVYSDMGSGLPLFSQQQPGGFEAGCAAATGIYPIDCSAIAPV